jgi:hypothetical protein
MRCGPYGLHLARLKKYRPDADVHPGESGRFPPRSGSRVAFSADVHAMGRRPRGVALVGVFAETVNVPDGLAVVSAVDRRVITRVCLEMERLGFALVVLMREEGPPGRWQAHWRPKDARYATVYGVSAESASRAARAALVEAESSLADTFPVHPA